ncbi:MAG: cardiac muscle actin [Benniella sp.]|nr:MAG: cardiac muscle actin [Benniella sp.]
MVDLPTVTSSVMHSQELRIKSLQETCDTDNAATVVIDNGSITSRGGFSEDETPRAVFPSVFGVNRAEDPRFACDLNLRCPIEHGIMTDWIAVEEIWRHIFNKELCIDPTDHPVLLTEALFNPKPNRETMIQVMFERFSPPAFYVAFQSVLSLYSTGRTNGVVLESGDSATHAVPVYEGYALLHSTIRFDLTGSGLTEQLMKSLTKRGYSFTTPEERGIVRAIKEKLCYVAQDYEQEIQMVAPSTVDHLYELPDGQAFFQPSVIGLEGVGVHEIVFNAIEKCDVDLRRDMFRNIILAGGTTLLPGFTNRMRTQFHSIPYHKTRGLGLLLPKKRMRPELVAACLHLSRHSKTCGA